MCFKNFEDVKKPKIMKLTERGILINNIYLAEKELREYDRFFDKLKKGKNLIECGMWDNFDVKVLSWDKEKGIIFGEWKEGEITKSRTFEYGELDTKPRNLTF